MTERGWSVPNTDLDVRPAYLSRIQKLYPGAVDVGRITGTRHLVKNQVRTMEKRGEIIAMQRFAKEIRPGVLEIPYVRMKTREQVRRGQMVKGGALLLASLGVTYGAGWLVWESRYVLALLAGALLAGAGVLYLSLHWSNGCSGIHCSGCRR